MSRFLTFLGGGRGKVPLTALRHPLSAPYQSVHQSTSTHEQDVSEHGCLEKEFGGGKYRGREGKGEEDGWGG